MNNVSIHAATIAKTKAMKVVGLISAKNSKLSGIAEVIIRSSQTRTYMFQEHHIPIYHCLCLKFEDRFFGE